MKGKRFGCCPSRKRLGEGKEPTSSPFSIQISHILHSRHFQSYDLTALMSRDDVMRRHEGWPDRPQR